MTGELRLVIGTQWGDEGKGGHVSRMAAESDIVARFNGGANAGHTTMYNGIEVNTHQIPSGIFHDGVLNVMGQGVLLDPVALREEAEDVERVAGIIIDPSKLMISDTAHMVLPHHKIADALEEGGDGAQGTTKRGIRFVAEAKYGRHGARAELITCNPDLLEKIAIDGLHAVNEKLERAGKATVDPSAVYAEWWQDAERMVPYLGNTSNFLDNALRNGKSVLGEGAQSLGLDLEEGIYPLGTSSHTTPGGALNGLGVSHEYLTDVFGVAKLTLSRVGGNGVKFPTYIDDPDYAAQLRGTPGKPDYEAGKSTGRLRDMGNFDLNQLLVARRVGITKFILTKTDCAHLFGRTMQVATAYNYDGEVIKGTPNSAAKLALCKPIYEEFDTWTGIIQDVRRIGLLPFRARKFIAFMEEYLEREVVVAGVGPGAEEFAVK